MTGKKQSSDAALAVIRISGREGNNSTRINGDFYEQNDEHNDKPYYKKKDADEILYYAGSSVWRAGPDFAHYFAVATGSYGKTKIEQTSDWKVWEGAEIGDVSDENIKIKKLSISKAIYDLVGCDVFAKDILKQSNEDILIFK
eukprot:830474_1